MERPNHHHVPRSHFHSINQFNHSVDVKRFSRDRHNHSPTFLANRKISLKSQDKVRQSNHPTYLPTSSLVPTLTPSFSKQNSHKHMKTKRKLSSGFQIIKTNHHSVSIDHHLLKEKYLLIQDTFRQGNYHKVVPLIRHSILHFQFSQEQKDLYFWLSLSLAHLTRYQQALEQLTECLQLYPLFQDAWLLSSQLHIRLGNFRHALKNAEEAVRINEKNQEACLQVARCFKQMGEVRKEKEWLEGCIEKFPRDGVFLMHLLQNIKAVGEGRGSVAKGWLKECNRRDSLWLYILGLWEELGQNSEEAYILFEEALKFNNHKDAVRKSLLEMIKSEIAARDFYKAYHSVGRIGHLQLAETEEIRVFATFIEGVMAMMKKKSSEAISTLLKIVDHPLCPSLGIHPLLHKYLGYGYFKMQDYHKSMNYYQKIGKQDMDSSSKYNLLLAEGVYLVDTQNRFADGQRSFRSAARVYPQKVEPYLYVAMTRIKQFNLKERIGMQKGEKAQVQKAQVLIEALKEMETASQLNPNSSNLLFHRTILHLYFEDWALAHEDINRCIEKAEENLPKYFYMRGVCHCCVRDFKKAINEFSICLSLEPTHQEAHFQKAKCYFLLGNTEKGFASLKSFIELRPEDLSIYKWIGDLLYEGRSYHDSIKSYDESQAQDFESLVMRGKCLFRIGSLNEVSALLKCLDREGDRGRLDETAFGLMVAILRGEASKVVIASVHKLNKMLEENQVGNIFQLIDCMNLLGVASFCLGKYSDAYESFLLVLELYQSLCEREGPMIRTEESEEQLDLRSEDIYFNIVISELARGHNKEALGLIEDEYFGIVSDGKQKKKIEKVAAALRRQGRQGDLIEWQFKSDKPFNCKVKAVTIDCGRFKVKTKPVFNLYHESADKLYSCEVADKIIDQLHPGYIDTMPEGPWIKRNPFGVVFTQAMNKDNSISLEETFRERESELESECELEEEQKKTISRKQQFLQRLKLDEGVQAKINQIIRPKDSFSN